MKKMHKLKHTDIFNGTQKKAVETHAHTKGSSPCAKVSEYDMLKAYKKSGYGAVIITNHFNENTVACHGLSPKAAVDWYVDFYKKAKEAGEQLDIEVWFGIETCIVGGPEDFLIFGAQSDILYENPKMYEMTQKELFSECEQYGCLLYQAHPSRSYCQHKDPNFIHGIESYNGNVRHEEHNEISLLWAKKFRLLQTSGSDFHQQEDIARGGILIPEDVHDEKAFADYIRQYEVTLITN